MTRGSRPLWLDALAVAVVVSVGVAGIMCVADRVDLKPGCNITGKIKGNISLNTGERIYHVPGGYYYDQTRIDFTKGERFFCSEAEARAAGWRRSRR